jgi:hypothetical protein
MKASVYYTPICNLNFLRIKNASRFVCCLLFTLVFVGCSNLILPDFVPKSSDQYPHREKSSGLEIVAQPFTDSQENMRIFGIDFLSMGYLPVLLIARNISTNDSFILKNSGVRIVNENAKESHNIDLNKQISGKQSELENAATVTAFIVPIASLFASVEIQNLQEIERNLVENKFYTSTVSPGKKVHGFIYLKLPEKRFIEQDSLVLSVDAYNIKTRETNEINISIGNIGKVNTSYEK